MAIPNFFIVGGSKCGTTTMYELLARHPEIFMPRWKEPHFFGSDLRSRPGISKDDYLALFARARRKKKRVGEASTGYLYSKRAAAEIKEFNAFARPIIMLRNPVDVLYSLHSQHVYDGREDIQDFAAALAADAYRKAGTGSPSPLGRIEHLFYREVVGYTEQTRRYLDVFGRENVMIIIFDDFARDTAGVYRETLCFLGVSPDFRPHLAIANPNKSFRSESFRGFLQRPPSVVRTLTHALMPRGLRQVLYVGLRRLNTSYKPRPPMEPELKKRLKSEFAPEVQQLSQLLGRDLSHWCNS